MTDGNDDGPFGFREAQRPQPVKLRGKPTKNKKINRVTTTVVELVHPVSASLMT